MIEIHDLKIETNNFSLIRIDENYDLTTATEYQGKSRSAGGITVRPTLAIQDVQEGHFLITQVCSYHKLEIFTTQGQHYKFQHENSLLKDTELPSYNHYNSWPIRNNRIRDKHNMHDVEVVFWDALNRELCRNWIQVDYAITFETWFQYMIQAEGVIKPILKFTWSANASVQKKAEEWSFTKKGCSSPSEISASVFRFDQMTASPLDTQGMDQLKSVVEGFLRQPGVILHKC